MTVLRQIQEWYVDQCDGDWEHQYGEANGAAS